MVALQQLGPLLPVLSLWWGGRDGSRGRRSAGLQVCHHAGHVHQGSRGTTKYLGGSWWVVCRRQEGGSLPGGCVELVWGAPSGGRLATHLLITARQ